MRKWHGGPCEVGMKTQGCEGEYFTMALQGLRPYRGFYILIFLYIVCLKMFESSGGGGVLQGGGRGRG